MKTDIYATLPEALLTLWLSLVAKHVFILALAEVTRWIAT